MTYTRNTEEEKKQRLFIEALKKTTAERTEASGRRPTYHIMTMGCQMNARDSEKLSGILTEIGAEETESENADILLFNTCTVRENANEKLYGHLGQVKRYKKANPDMLIGICGCMMQEKDEVLRIRQRYPFVDLVFGTHNFWKFPELLYASLTGRERVFDTAETPDQYADHMPVRRKYSFKSGVNIMYGCDNFCTYCIVPYVRGRERSREPEEIIDEIRALVNDGVKEVMLLGQNVNSYGKTLEIPVSFADLLRRVSRIPGLERVRFMTPHPKDLSDDLIRVIREEPKVCHHLHLPLQSGSTRLLKRMNRHYTKESYLDLVRRIREAVPDIGLTTDIIVGFPGETDEDFEDTLDVIRACRFQSAFTFIYSRRTGTPAASYEDQVPEDVTAERMKRLLALVSELAGSVADRGEGETAKVLVEGLNDHMPGWLTGRLGNNLMVHFEGDASLVGEIVDVELTESKGFYYMGRLKG